LRPDKTTFVTPSEDNFQGGFIVYPEGGEVKRHAHLPVKREICGTSEVIMVREGLCEISIYSETRELAATRVLAAGDIAIIVSGGHGFRMLEDTVLLEVKQGPYAGTQDKEHF